MAERTDDGRRYMPKLKCPYGNHRFADVPDVALRNDSELKRLSEAYWSAPTATKRLLSVSRLYTKSQQNRQVSLRLASPCNCHFAWRTQSILPAVNSGKKGSVSIVKP